MVKVVVHPGFIRTATTTLQEAAFSQAPGIHYLGRPFRNREVASAISAICTTDGVRFNADAVRDVLRRQIVEHSVNLLSHENLASHKAKDKRLVASRIKQVFPDACILFTIRNQRDLLRSWYLFRSRPPRPYIPFNVWWRTALDTPNRTIFDDINFDDTIGCYEELFGRERVGVFTYERLRDAPEQFAQDVAGFAGLDAAAIAKGIRGQRLNASITVRHLTWAKFVAAAMPANLTMYVGDHMPVAIARRFSTWQSLGARPELPFSDAQERTVHALCAEGNRQLTARYGLPLAQLGYPI